jgi:hypothetical protein
MTKDKIAHDTYRKLKVFYDNKILVHFKDFNEIFYNGEIISLDQIGLSMLFKENKRGTIPFLLEEINPDSIVKFKEEIK